MQNPNASVDEIKALYGPSKCLCGKETDKTVEQRWGFRPQHWMIPHHGAMFETWRDHLICEDCFEKSFRRISLNGSDAAYSIYQDYRHPS